MWNNSLRTVLLLCLIAKFSECKKTFVVIGSQTVPYRGKYSVAVSSTGYNKPETLQVKIFGKLDGGSDTYENSKNVTLKRNGLEIINFDLKDQKPGNYFLKISDQSLQQSARLNLNTKKLSVFIQTDKAIYKPGDKVQFRVLILNGETKPVMTKSVEIFITDNDYNRVKQFDQTYFRRGVFRGELQLSDHPVNGIWSIHVKVNEGEAESVKSFEVAEYVLPKFEVKVKTKSKITESEDIVVSFDAKYTYGKDVDGSATVSAELMDSWWDPVKKNFFKILDNSTKVTTINLANDLNLNSITWIRTVLITVTFTEALTGKQQNGTSIVQVYNIPYTIDILGSAETIKPNIPFTANIFVKDINEIPVTDDVEPVTINITFVYDSYETINNTDNWPFYMWWRPPIQRVISLTKLLKNGMTEFPISVTANVTSVNIEVFYKNAVGYLFIRTLPTESNQYIEIKVQNEKLSIAKLIEAEIVSNVKVTSVNYIVLAKNKIVTGGKFNAVNSNNFKLKIQPTIEMIPMANIIVFYIAQNGEIISDKKSLNFNTELKNFVDIKLSKTEAKPSSLVNISVRSDPKSYVGLLGVDQSVLLLKSGNDIDKKMVSDELTQYQYADKYNSDWDEMATYNYYTDFSSSEAVILTNAKEEYRRPYPFPIYPVPIDFVNQPSAETRVPTTSTVNLIPSTTVNPENIPSPLEIVTRKEFPETWLFDCIDNIRGNTTITRRVPDTITSWIITGFSLDFQNGLGLSDEPTKLTVFMPFFVSLNLPYSIKRGETIAIEVNVFNYMNQDHPATVTMSNEKQEFEFVENTENKQYVMKNITTKSNSGTTVVFVIKALKIGYMTLKIEARTSVAGDRVEQLLLVEAEGVKRFINEAILVDLRTENKFSKSTMVSVPQDIVPDSLRIEASFIGDILGPTIENLDNLLQMPYGCGEQNMLNFVPDIIILDYLIAVNKLTPQIEAKAKKYMEAGYQTELTFKRFDGSYSAFGNSDSFGSTWLTAFVARSFKQASKYITIDTTAIEHGLNFLSTIQAEDGSFPEHGIVHHKPMQGGSSSGTGLTAYVLITFLENEAVRENYGKVIDKAIDNLLNHTKDIDDVYTMSIVSYALYLAGKTTEGGSLLQELDKKANNTLGTRHWDKSTGDIYVTSLSIETSAYGLLAYLEAKRETDALLIAKWLVTQRNKFGGFSSTQDTVVGLLALSRIAAKITVKSIDMKIEVKYEGTSKLININQANGLVLQKLEIPHTVRNVEILANGIGFAIAQISYHFNVNEPKKISNFILRATAKTRSLTGLTLDACIELKNLNQSNMAVMEISALSGYTFDSESQTNIIDSATNIKKVDFKNGNTLIQIYFDYLNAESQCLSANLSKVFEVTEQKPASVIVYDYYENDMRSEVLYTPPQ